MRSLTLGQRNLAASLLSGGFLQVALMVSGILVARTLGPENRGHLAMLALIPSILTQFGSLGLPAAVTYSIASHKAPARHIIQLVKGPMYAQVLVLTIIHAVVLIPLLQFRTEDVSRAGIISLVAVWASLSSTYGLSFLQGEQRFRLFNILRLMPSLLYSAGIAAVFFGGGGGLQLVTFVWIAASALAAITTMRVAIRVAGKVGHSQDAASLALRQEPPVKRSKMLTFGIRGLLGSVSPIETFRIDQLIVGLWLPPSALGLYVVGLAFTNLPRFVAQGVGMVAYPSVSSKQDADQAAQAMWRYFWFAVLVTLALVLPLILSVGVLIPFFFGIEFSDAASVTRILLLASFFVGIRRVLTDGLRGRGFPGAGTLAEAVSWATLIPCLIVLTARAGLQGVATALTLSSASSFAFLLALAVFRFKREPAKVLT
jgi:O-antigen/teichoic acid export membrane protein